MDRENWLEKLEHVALFSFSRSSGPGGQNVNKVNTKVLIQVPLEQLHWLTEDQKDTLRVKLASRINGEGFLCLQVQDHRTQLANRWQALERLADLLLSSLRPQRRRRGTSPTRASRERRLAEKKARGETKRHRGANVFRE